MQNNKKILYVPGLFIKSKRPDAMNYNWFDKVERIDKQFKERLKEEPEIIIGHSEGCNIILNNIKWIKCHTKIILLCPVVYPDNIRQPWKTLSQIIPYLRLDLRDKFRGDEKVYNVLDDKFLKDFYGILNYSHCSHNEIIKELDKVIEENIC